VDSDWKLDLFASLTVTTEYNKPTVITAWIIFKAYLIFTLRELIFLPIFRPPCSMPEIMASTDLGLLVSGTLLELDLLN
jgi:hypothetical protein